MYLSINYLRTEEGCFLEYEGTYFKVQPLFFNIFKMKSDGYSLNEICIFINKQFEFELDEIEISEIIEIQTEKLNKLFKKKESYINWKITLIPEKSLNKICIFFTFLFTKKIFFTFLLIALFVNFFYLQKIDISLEFDGNWLFFYIVIFFSGLFHEIGHSSGSLFYKIKPKGIGFGFFLIFPVFYSDVTKIWLINKKKRVIVNIAGVYFQLLFISVFILLDFIYPEILGGLLNIVIYTNYMMILVSINPFFRNDGYWIISDYFEIPNLVKEAYSLPYNIFYKQDILNKYSIKQKIILFFYSLSLYIIIVLIAFYLKNSFNKEYLHFLEIVKSNSDSINMLLENKYFFLKIILKYTLIFTIIYKKIKKIV